jgi:hypothetical protein
LPLHPAPSRQKQEFIGDDGEFIPLSAKARLQQASARTRCGAIREVELKCIDAPARLPVDFFLTMNKSASLRQVSMYYFSNQLKFQPIRLGKIGIKMHNNH